MDKQSAPRERKSIALNLLQHAIFSNSTRTITAGLPLGAAGIKQSTRQIDDHTC